MSRLAAGLWVQAYLRRLQIEHVPAYVAAKGDPTAGAVIVKTATLDGRAVAKQRSFDPDLWVIEVEDRQGRHLLNEPGLS